MGFSSWITPHLRLLRRSQSYEVPVKTQEVLQSAAGVKRDEILPSTCEVGCPCGDIHNDQDYGHNHDHEEESSLEESSPIVPALQNEKVRVRQYLMNPKSNPIQFVTDLSDLQLIGKKHVQMAIWRDDPLPSFVTHLNDDSLDISDFPTFEGMVDPNTVNHQLRSDFTFNHDAIEPAVVDDLIEDIERLVRVFAEISKNSFVYLKFKTIDTSNCEFWHRDFVKFRLVRTYRGPCTEYVQPLHSNRTLKRKQEDSQYAESLSNKDTAIFKGSGNSDLRRIKIKQQGIVHRSPRLKEGSGKFRLVVILDIPQVGWHY